jgi:hypothetical protein
VVNRQPRTRWVIVRMLFGGMMVLLSLPLLSPLMVGTLITRAIYGVDVLTRGLRSDGHGDDRPGEPTAGY